MFNEIILIYSKLAGASFVLGFLLIAHGYNRKNYIKKLLKTGTKTEGKVIEIYQRPVALFSNKQVSGFAPVVEYKTNSNNTLKHYSNTFRDICPYQVGQVVDIWYINYKSIREATLADDLPGVIPNKLMLTGFILLLFSLPKIYFSLSQLYL